MSRERSLCGKEEIIKVAIEIVDNEGMEALSARRIAKELGVSSMTIYNYVKNLNDVKKRVLIEGFDRLYNRIYQAMSSIPKPIGRKQLCKVMALEMFHFSQENSSMFSFMFSDGRRLFHEDAEVRPFYTFLTKIISRHRGNVAGWWSDNVPYNLFEIITTTISYLCAQDMLKLSDKDFGAHIDFYIEHCIDD